MGAAPLGGLSSALSNSAELDKTSRFPLAAIQQTNGLQMMASPVPKTIKLGKALSEMRIIYKRAAKFVSCGTGLFPLLWWG